MKALFLIEILRHRRQRRFGHPEMIQWIFRINRRTIDFPFSSPDEGIEVVRFLMIVCGYHPVLGLYLIELMNSMDRPLNGALEEEECCDLVESKEVAVAPLFFHSTEVVVNQFAA